MNIGTVSYLLSSSTHTASDPVAFQKVIDYLLTFVGEIELQKERPNFVRITYPGTDLMATLGVGDGMMLTCVLEDQVTVGLIRNVTKNIGYRIFCDQTKSFLLNDPNVLDLTTTKLDSKMVNVFKQYKLEPLFQYRESLVFFAKDKKGSMHLVNRHLLEYLMSHPEAHHPAIEFSVVVARDIGRFVALFDRGLIPVSFYKYVNSDKTILNLSGFPIDHFTRDVLVEPIYFQFDRVNQTFIQGSAPGGIPLKEGQSLARALKLKHYLAIKVAQDIGYHEHAGKLIPKLSVSVYLDVE